MMKLLPNKSFVAQVLEIKSIVVKDVHTHKELNTNFKNFVLITWGSKEPKNFQAYRLPVPSSFVYILRGSWNETVI